MVEKLWMGQQVQVGQQVLRGAFWETWAPPKGGGAVVLGVPREVEKAEQQVGNRSGVQRKTLGEKEYKFGKSGQN